MKIACYIYQLLVLYIAVLCSCILTDVLVYEPDYVDESKIPVPEVQYNRETHFMVYWNPNKEKYLAGYHWNWIVDTDTIIEAYAIPKNINWKIFNRSKMEGNHRFYLSAFGYNGKELKNKIYVLQVIDGIPILKEEEL